MMTQHPIPMRLFSCAVVFALLTACSAMLIGEGTSGSPAIGSDHRSTAQVADDNGMAKALRSAFASDSLLRSEKLSVSVSNGIVTLSGVVGSFEARDRAVGVARNVAGITRVKSQLQVNTHQ